MMNLNENERNNNPIPESSEEKIENLTPAEPKQSEGSPSIPESKPETAPQAEPSPAPAEEPVTPPTPAEPIRQDIPSPAVAEHVYSSYTQPPVPEKKKKKAKRGMSGGAVAVLLVCSMLLSCASGFFGAYLATEYFAPATENSVQSPASGNHSSTVIHQSATSPVGGMSSSSGSVSYAEVAKAVKDSVVEITTEYRVESYFQYVSTGAGSGVIISADGYIITNNHVIADTSSNNELADAITVRLTTGEEFPAKVIGTDSDSDIAVIKIESETAFPFAVMGNSANLAVGEEVVAVGNPLGELGGTVTNGIISALNREINVDGTTMNLLQTNTAINPGNSGGGLFNMSGELIGIVNAKSSGSDIEGLGFAIPINEALSVSEQLMTQGYVSGKPYLGVEFYSATNMSQALYYGLPSLGIYVARLEEGLNDKVFEIADRVIAVDGKEIGSFSDISTIVKSHKPGDTITFSVYRKGKLIEVKATCFEYVPEMGTLVESESQPGGKN